MPARLPLMSLLFLVAAAGAAETQWQAPKILPPKGEATATAPAAPGNPAPARPTASGPAAPASASAGAATPKPASARPASAPELAAKIKEKLEQQAAAPPPRSRNGAGHAGSSFMTHAELQARMRAAASAAKQPLPPPGKPAAVKSVKLALAPAAAAPRPRQETNHRAHASHAAHWSYEGPDGPEHWARLSPDWARCADGRRQSPIDIRDGIQLDLEEPLVEYQSSRFAVLDNGHTIQVDVQSPNYITLTGRRYQLQQFHFHRPAEERLDGRGFEMVVHLVHKDADGRLMVVAVMIEAGNPHAGVQAVWNNLPLEKNESVAPATLLDITQFLPAERRYYTYMGSLTTPPCSEGVLWVVMKQPVRFSEQQIRIFSRLYPMNARPLQPASDRLIKESN